MTSNENTDNTYEQQSWDERQGLLLRAIANRLYQQRRRARFEWLESLTKVASLLLGSAALVAVTPGGLIKVFAVLVLLGSVSSLVFQWGTKARDAAKRQDEWTSLEKKIVGVGKFDFESQLPEWQACAAEIEAGEDAIKKKWFDSSESEARRILKMNPVAR